MPGVPVGLPGVGGVLVMVAVPLGIVPVGVTEGGVSGVLVGVMLGVMVISGVSVGTGDGVSVKEINACALSGDC